MRRTRFRVLARAPIIIIVVVVVLCFDTVWSSAGRSRRFRRREHQYERLSADGGWRRWRDGLAIRAHVKGFGILLTLHAPYTLCVFECTRLCSCAKNVFAVSCCAEFNTLKIDAQFYYKLFVTPTCMFVVFVLSFPSFTHRTNHCSWCCLKSLIMRSSASSPILSRSVGISASASRASFTCSAVRRRGHMARRRAERRECLGASNTGEGGCGSGSRRAKAQAPRDKKERRDMGQRARITEDFPHRVRIL